MHVTCYKSIPKRSLARVDHTPMISSFILPQSTQLLPHASGIAFFTQPLHQSPYLTLHHLHTAQHITSHCHWVSIDTILITFSAAVTTNIFIEVSRVTRLS